MVFSQPLTLSEYFTNTGDTKYPNDPAQVTIPVAIVLFDAGKCIFHTMGHEKNGTRVPVRLKELRTLLRCQLEPWVQEFAKNNREDAATIKRIS